MNALFLWMRVEPKGKGYWEFVFQMTLVCLAYVVAVVSLQAIILGHVPDVSRSLDFLRGRPLVRYPELFLMIAWEEVRFRLPLIPFILFRVRPSVLFVAALVLSIYFGYMHLGPSTIPIQGVHGFLFCVVFLKCGGLDKKFGKAFVSAFLVHSAYNFSQAALVALFFL